MLRLTTPFKRVFLPTVTHPHWPWQQATLALGSGIAMNLALPPVSLWPLAWVALVPLWLIALSTATGPWWLAATYGLLWGLGYYGSSLAWITHLHPLMWMGVPWVGSIAIATGSWGFITLWGSVCVAAWSVCLHWLIGHRPHQPVLRIVMATALWCTLETLRNYTPLDWSSLSLTQSPNNLWILHLARLSGPMAITAALVATNGCLAEAGWKIASGSPQGTVWLNPSSRNLGSGALVIVLLTHGVGAGLYSLPAPDAPSQMLTLGLIQGNVPTREKLTLAGINRAVQGYTTGYLTLAEQGVDAVVTPEGSIPLLWDDDSAQLTPLIQAVRQTGVPLWLGTFAPAPGTGDHWQYTQSLLEIRQDGLPHGRYNKVQLVPLGEYIPFEAVLGRLIDRLSPLDSYLVPGKIPQNFRTSLGQGIVGICYESVYSRLFRLQAEAGGEFILTASNNDPYPTHMMIQHHALDVQRAVETDRWAMRVTNTGLSGLVDSHGHTQWLLSPREYMAQSGTLYRHQRRTLYVSWGDWLTPLLVGLGLSLLLLKTGEWHR